MKPWLKRVRAAVLMGLMWAVVWAPAAVVIGIAIDPDNSMDEMWAAIGAFPGFLGGVLFSVVLSVVARHRRFDDLSLPRFAAWGALAGFLVGVLPMLIAESSATTPGWLIGLIAMLSLTVLSAASAAGSLALARRSERRALRAADDTDAGAIAASDAPRTLARRD